MNLLKTHEVFFTGLTTLVKNQQKKHSIMKKNNDTKKHKKLKKKTNYKTAIYQDRYVLHTDTESFGC